MVSISARPASTPAGAVECSRAGERSAFPKPVALRSPHGDQLVLHPGQLREGRLVLVAVAVVVLSRGPEVLHGRAHACRAGGLVAPLRSGSAGPRLCCASCSAALARRPLATCRVALDLRPRAGGPGSGATAARSTNWYVSASGWPMTHASTLESTERSQVISLPPTPTSTRSHSRAMSVVVGEELLERFTGEEAQVRLIEQADGPIVELALQQREAEVAMGDVRDRQHHLALRASRSRQAWRHRAGSLRCSRTSAATITSNVASPSAAGRSRTSRSPTMTSSAHSLASWAASGSISMAVTRHPRSANTFVTDPVAHPSSSTRLSDPTMRSTIPCAPSSCEASAL